MAKLGNLPRLRAGDPDEIQVKKINEAITRIEQAFADVNMLSGTRKQVVVQNGVALTVATQTSSVVFLKVAPVTGTFSEPTYMWRPVSGGFEVTVTWTGTATSCDVHMLVGDK